MFSKFPTLVSTSRPAGRTGRVRDAKTIRPQMSMFNQPSHKTLIKHC